MKIRVYQINREKDKNRFIFCDYDYVVRKQGHAHICRDLYDVVFEGDVDCRNLEDIYVLFNSSRAPEYHGHSMSVSDIVEVISEENDVKQGVYYCDSIGFKEVELR